MGNAIPQPLTTAPQTRIPKRYNLSPKPYTQNPNPYTLLLNPTPYTLHPTPYTPNPTPYTLHPAPCTANPKPDKGEGAGDHIDRRGYCIIVVAEGAGVENFSAAEQDLGTDASGNRRLPDVGTWLKDSTKRWWADRGRCIQV